MSTFAVHNALLCSAHYVQRALERLDENTEYLRDELEEQADRLHVLLEKMNYNDALTRDRAYLQSPDPPAEGLTDWIGGTDGSDE